MTKILTTDKQTTENSTIDNETGFWLNRTKSGKGVIIVIEEKAFISSMKNLQEFVEEKRRGIRFNLLK